MPNLLTPTQAANALRVSADDPRLLNLLPQVDAFVQHATGRDWTQDATVHPTAVSAATMLLVLWFENPATTGSLITDAPLQFGLTNALLILESEALKYRKYQFGGAESARGIALADARLGDQVISLVGVYGVTGDQAAQFEPAISVAGQIQQIANSDLSDNLYVVILKAPGEDVMP